MFLCLGFAAIQARSEVPGPLVGAALLAENPGQFRILDLRRDRNAFIAEGHVPGSVFVPWNEVRVARIVGGVKLVGMLPDRAAFDALMRRFGVDNDSSVVIVHGGRSAGQVTLATRLYWQLKYFGHDNVAILDGGMAAWRRAGLAVAHDVPSPPPPGTFSARAERHNLLATTDDVRAAVPRGSATLFDARDFGQYLGLYHDPAKLDAGGHIPGSKFMPVDALLAPGPVKTFLPSDKIAAALRGLGADEEAIAYCNTGNLASGTWFAMHELAGNERARLYDGSMNAWTRAGLPVTANRPD